MIRPRMVSSRRRYWSMRKKGIDSTMGGMIRWEMKKKVMSAFLTNPRRKVKRESPYAARVPRARLIRLAKPVTRMLLMYGPTMSMPCPPVRTSTFQPSRDG